MIETRARPDHATQNTGGRSSDHGGLDGKYRRNWSTWALRFQPSWTEPGTLTVTARRGGCGLRRQSDFEGCDAKVADFFVHFKPA